MKTKLYQLTTLSIIAALALCCSEKSDPAYDQDNFTSIFDNNQFSASNFPIDFKQTSDGGYLILGERKLLNSNFRGIYLMKADKNGKFVAEANIDEQYVNPIGEFMLSGSDYYFFCMDALSLQSQLVKVDANAANVIITPVSVGLTYPAAASADGANFLLLSYDHEDKLSVVSRINASGAVVGQPIGFDIGVGDAVEEPLINHFIRTGKRFPFQIGKLSGGLYFFNGFVNYTFSLVFTDLNANGTSGVVQGQQDDGGLSAIYPLGGNKFATARFNFGDNYFLPNVNLVMNAPSSSDDLGGNTLPELVSNAPVRIIKAQINQKSTLIYASDTRSRQIGLFFYDEPTGEFISSRYLGFSNPFEVASLIQTSDEGLAVCGTTYLAGRFPRICIIKLSKEELGHQGK
jgi:hypothetical protein